MDLPQFKRAKGRPRTKSPQIRTTLVINDLHIPYHDTQVLQSFIHFYQETQPDFLIINGDLIDAYELSKFDKNPARFGMTIDEIEQADAVLDQIQQSSPSTKIIYCLGNHCARVALRFREHPELIPWATRTRNADDVLPKTLSLAERGIKWLPYMEDYNHHGFIFTHGKYTGVQAAKKEVFRTGRSGASGHLHQDYVFYQKGDAYYWSWHILGGMCLHQMDYMYWPNWSHSFGVLHQLIGHDTYSFYPVSVINGRFMWGGKLYTPEGVFEAA